MDEWAEVLGLPSSPLTSATLMTQIPLALLRSFWNGFLGNCINTLPPAPPDVAFQYRAAEGLGGRVLGTEEWGTGCGEAVC